MFHQVPVAPAAEPEVAFLVHDPYKTMMKLVIFIHVLVVRCEDKLEFLSLLIWIQNLLAVPALFVIGES